MIASLEHSHTMVFKEHRPVGILVHHYRFNRQHLTCDGCLEDEKEDNQNYYVR